MHQSLTAFGWLSCTANWYCCGRKKASIIGTQTWFTFFMIFREEVKTSRIKLYSERSHRHSTKLVEVSLRFPTPAPARRWKDGTGLMNKILIKCTHVVCPNNVSLICINLLGLLTHVEVSSVIDLQANNVGQTDSSGSGRCPPNSPSLFSFFEIKIQASRTIHYYDEEWKKWITITYCAISSVILLRQ